MSAVGAFRTRRDVRYNRRSWEISGHRNMPISSRPRQPRPRDGLGSRCVIAGGAERAPRATLRDPSQCRKRLNQTQGAADPLAQLVGNQDVRARAALAVLPVNDALDQKFHAVGGRLPLHQAHFSSSTSFGEAMAEELKGRVVGGEGKEAEVDGGYFGGYVKPANHKAHRVDRRFSRNQSGKRRVVVVVRERGGNSVPAVFNSESQAASFIRARIAKGCARRRSGIMG